MQYTTTEYPPAMQPLDDEVRAIAIKEANRFLEDGYREGRSIAMGIARARDWDENGRTFDVDEPSGPKLHVLHDQGRWMICPEGASEPSHVFGDLDLATRRAHELATENRSALYVYSPEGDLIEKNEDYGPEPEEVGALEVSPDDGSWTLNNRLSGDLIGRFERKSEAVKAARAQAREAKTRLVIRYRDGEVQKEHGYSDG